MFDFETLGSNWFEEFGIDSDQKISILPYFIIFSKNEYVLKKEFKRLKNSFREFRFKICFETFHSDFKRSFYFFYIFNIWPKSDFFNTLVR